MVVPPSRRSRPKVLSFGPCSDLVIFLDSLNDSSSIRSVLFCLREREQQVCLQLPLRSYSLLQLFSCTRVS